MESKVWSGMEIIKVIRNRPRIRLQPPGLYSKRKYWNCKRFILEVGPLNYIFSMK